jgi:uncharacterized protein (DUF1778 family)
MKTNEKSRLDIRLAKEKKELFEHVARLGGFKTLTDLVIFSVEKEAKKIIEEHETMLASQRDRETFFDALMSPPEPNEKLKRAASRYLAFIKE